MLLNEEHGGLEGALRFFISLRGKFHESCIMKFHLFPELLMNYHYCVLQII